MGTADNCVQDGPFANIRLRYSDTEVRPHCLRRQFMEGFPESGLQEMIGFAYDDNVVAGLFTHTTYASFRFALEGGPHGAVHAGVGGDLGRNSSTNGK
jgi:tyrosinase